MSKSRRKASTDQPVLITQETENKPVEQQPEFHYEKEDDAFPEEQVGQVQTYVQESEPGSVRLTQAPSIGRVVIYVPRETDNEFITETVGHVTRVVDKDASKVNLFITGDYKTGFRHNVPFEDEESEVGYWKWPERV